MKTNEEMILQANAVGVFLTQFRMPTEEMLKVWSDLPNEHLVLMYFYEYPTGETFVHMKNIYDHDTSVSCLLSDVTQMKLLGLETEED